MKKKCVEYLNNLITEDTPKKEIDIIEFCLKAVKEYKETKVSRSKFEIPTIDEIKKYIAEYNYSVDPIGFFKWYDATGWRDARGKKVRNWKLKIISWDKKDKEKNLTYHQTDKKAQAREYTPQQVQNMFDSVEEVEL